MGGSPSSLTSRIWFYVTSLVSFYVHDGLYVGRHHSIAPVCTGCLGGPSVLSMTTKYVRFPETDDLYRFSRGDPVH